VRIKHLLRSAPFRLALLYLLLFSVSALTLLWFFYWSTAGYIARQSDATIRAEIKGLAERYETDGLTGLTALVADRLERQKPGDSSIYLLADARFKPLIGNVTRWPPANSDPDGWVDFELGDDRSGKLHRARAQVFRLRGGRYHLLVGRDMFELQATQELILQTLVWGLLITVGLGLLGGVMLSRSAMGRLDAINKAVQEIMSGNLARRLPSNGGGDELDRLSQQLNRMLDQIETSVDGVRRVSDNIAHDLKTPLARLRNRLESLSKPGLNENERVTLAEQAIGEADGLLKTFNALLRIARIESEARHAEFKVLDMNALLRDVKELYEPVAETRQQNLLLIENESASLRGDRDLLFQALANLVDNAIKYTPAGGEIVISLLPEEIRICDSGMGIPEAEHEQVFQRFYRGEQSRTTPGSGLGLSLVQAVIKLHELNITLRDNNPGLCVQLSWGSGKS